MPIKIEREPLIQVAIYRFERNTPYLVMRCRVRNDTEALRVVDYWKRERGWTEVRAYEILPDSHPDRVNLNHTTRAITEDGNQYTC